MHLNHMAWAVPLFLGLMGLEYLVARKTGKNYFGFASSVSNINVGIAERLLDTFTVGIFYFVYEFLHTHFAIFDIKPGFLLWVSLLLLTDFIWYWYHRLAHEVNFLWAAHVVHHQSDDFNYTVSARITVFQAFARMCFWSVLPVIGFPPVMIISVQLVHGIYPFFIHTRTIPKLGFLEYIFVTPSHHRVHHASNDHYLDKNYGDVFIFWDKLFGTFVVEGEEPVYGLTKPLDSNSFLWQHFHFILEIVYTVKQTSGFRERLRVVFGRPDKIDPEMRARLEKRFLSPDKAEHFTRRLHAYVVWQVIGLLVVLFSFLLLEYYVPVFVQVCITLVIFLTLINTGAILEQKRWVFYLEYVRLLIGFVIICYYWPSPSLYFCLLVIQLPFLLLQGNMKRGYERLLYGG
ncbi:sterol desaturase family protein [Chitinophaga sancti]|uniref:Sterol desaturase family protein n=2 Tax=Chitinophaga sancti TaxID=1004 RepID=A0ABZ0X947_9BACT|nr:sterol desaturase family protein [Chitinophaga sancti]WQD60747.1 sterol desaturase family protein [Chitinophaga sancti]WQG87125.1 sterol desaturase family protein [Chitinophaga sancti]